MTGAPPDACRPGGDGSIAVGDRLGGNHRGAPLRKLPAGSQLEQKFARDHCAAPVFTVDDAASRRGTAQPRHSVATAGFAMLQCGPISAG